MVLLCLELGRPAEAFHYVERARSRAFLDTLVKKSPELYDCTGPAGGYAGQCAGAAAGRRAAARVFHHRRAAQRRAHAQQHPRVERAPAPAPDAAATGDPVRDHPRPLRDTSAGAEPEQLAPAGRRSLPRPASAARPAAAAPVRAADRAGGRSAGRLPRCCIWCRTGRCTMCRSRRCARPPASTCCTPNGPALAHAPSATILLRNCIGRPPARGSATLAIGFNDPQGDQPLRYAEAEAQHVARILGGAAWIGTGAQERAADRRRFEHPLAAYRRPRALQPHDPLGSDCILGRAIRSAPARSSAISIWRPIWSHSAPVPAASAMSSPAMSCWVCSARCCMPARRRCCVPAGRRAI